ncbi:MAG: AMP-dependent synthetase/ligase [Verrucomicrobia bacterium]|nr:AMP-dependent synthetase/ligase [Verrucomicrobiota bacterium]
MTTIKQLLLDSATKRDSSIALRYKQRGTWHPVTYQQLLRNTRCVAEMLAELKIRPGDKVAIHLDNCPEWPEIYFGITGIGAVAVPVDAKLREQEVTHILRDSETTVAFASAKTYKLIREIEESLPDLEYVILVGGAEVMPSHTRKVNYRDYADIQARVQHRADAENCAFNRGKPSGDDVASIIYTSGTTGRQKGAMLTHRNFCSNVAAALEEIAVSADDNFLLVLPLHHSFAFTTNLLVPIAAGAEISFIESLKTVGENVREVSPTILIGVPLLIEKMYSRMRLRLKENKVASTLYALHLRKPVIKGILKGLGGKLRTMVVGGAPSDPEVLKGFAELGIPVLEGYGLTETAPILTMNPPAKPKPGSVGRALKNVEIKIMDPNGEGIGEIAARGPNIMKGYYNAPEATAQVFQDGWFVTGDLGFIDDEGYITITGRKKSLIVNREGKNIYPEEVETQVCKSEFILEALALGYTEGGETGERVGVIVVPNQDAIDAHVEKTKKALSDQELEDLLRKEVKRVTQDIADYKRPRRIQIRTEEFEKTSTSKVKRYLYSIELKEV